MNKHTANLKGLGNHHESEALEGALVKGCNSPQKVPYGLYAEQLSGSAFTSPRHINLSSWLYRIRPSVLHGEFHPVLQTDLAGTPFDLAYTPPTQMRWDPMPYPAVPRSFIEGLVTLAGNGSIEMQGGAAIHLYCATRSMHNEFFYNADGEFLIVPQEGALRFKTEFGSLDAKPGELIVIPRGIKFQVQLIAEKARGYICENFGSPFRLPELGVIGANGLANPRDFHIPSAAFEDREGNFILITKFQGQLWQAAINHSPLDVVAWHGTYAPYKYDLALFNTINTVSFDHPDPSIFTVLTSPSPVQGVANIDFVIFPPRWMVAKDTFRPPYYHRNIMSEYMGLIHGAYDAKETGFVPGGGSLHNCMSAHGPDAAAFNKAVSAALEPEYYDNTLAFMFESRQVWRLTPAAYNADFRQKDYLACWQELKSHFQAKSIA
ncbi:homogentisate 1,2-dioxygenase [Aquicella lusitana]|uniref:Homogentisate 1,2-dioxygenase n=1 Tax=Aquicella lusitana TaxID=254246 RepID=A0A370GKB8_9COXI|nr:homogentisate 1,2-dioxygenase [Aquicella lusitana]RDI43810.1 homogentisate 1,2-dioxygenase [Aquicella lusitana]VVC74459.1 Homogentisate 1,2-dioxygenase [Aquicella lusitana]